eukprot:c16439_g1_i1.p1 GENE.c16439_g1_i1~~c16439_g1_i1.p1  ORF type:complete len:560 (+),score=89.60 c16439_g1_i1:51-1730(+)
MFGVKGFPLGLDDGQLRAIVQQQEVDLIMKHMQIRRRKSDKNTSQPSMTPPAPFGFLQRVKSMISVRFHRHHSLHQMKTLETSRPSSFSVIATSPKPRARKKRSPEIPFCVAANLKKYRKLWYDESEREQVLDLADVVTSEVGRDWPNNVKLSFASLDRLSDRMRDLRDEIKLTTSQIRSQPFPAMQSLVNFHIRADVLIVRASFTLCHNHPVLFETRRNLVRNLCALRTKTDELLTVCGALVDPSVIPFLDDRYVLTTHTTFLHEPRTTDPEGSSRSTSPETSRTQVPTETPKGSERALIAATGMVEELWTEVLGPQAENPVQKIARLKERLEEAMRSGGNPYMRDKLKARHALGQRLRMAAEVQKREWKRQQEIKAGVAQMEKQLQQPIQPTTQPTTPQTTQQTTTATLNEKLKPSPQKHSSGYSKFKLKFRFGSGGPSEPKSATKSQTVKHVATPRRIASYAGTASPREVPPTANQNPPTTTSPFSEHSRKPDGVFRRLARRISQTVQSKPPTVEQRKISGFGVPQVILNDSSFRYNMTEYRTATVIEEDQLPKES